MRIHLTLKSTNKKTGKIPVSTTSAETCPPKCPWIGAGCYADLGPLGLHWRKVSNGERGDNWTDFLGKIRALPNGQLWRHNQAGDLPGTGNRIHRSKLRALTAVSSHTRGFTYTHKPVEGRSNLAINNRRAIIQSNSNAFTINLSANSLAHADELMELNVAPVTCILPSDETRPSFFSPAGNKVTTCPASIRDDTTCMTCELCALPKRKTIIGFPAHGTKVRQVNERLRMLT